MIRKHRPLFVLFILFFSIYCRAETADLAPVILDQKPHSQESFTQGLIVENNEITESSGLYGQSYLVRYNAQDNQIIKKLNLDGNYFGEGITQMGDAIYLLTWKEQKVFVINAATFIIEKTLPYKGEGWGMTHDGKHLITSDGSDRLFFRDTATFNVTKTVKVHEGKQSWSQINELEFAQGFIWANVWQGSMILAIDPATGEVKAKADLSDLVKKNNHTPYSSVLNGIAYDKKANAFWITGKLWPNRYLIKFVWPAAQTKQVPATSNAKSQTHGK